VESSWPTALAFVERPENDGQGLHVDPGDPGGATNRGVDLASWQDAEEAGLVSGTLAAATQVDLALVLHDRFWLACQCDKMPAGVDLAVYNFAMVAGIHAAARLAEAVSGAPLDRSVYIIGPVTLAHIARMDPAAMIRAFTSAEEKDYAACADAWRFLKGWDRRAGDCQVVALQLAGTPA
jgi:lysozyme family protein